MSKPLLMLVALFFAFTMVGQKKEAFTTLNLPADELFLPLSNSKVEIADGCSITSESDVKTVGSWLAALSRSSQDETKKLPNYADIQLSIMQDKAEDLVDRMVFVHKPYLDIVDPSQIETDENGMLYSSVDYTQWSSEKNAFFLYSSAEKEISKYQFTLEAEYFISDEPIEMYTIDLHNEKGEQPLELDKIYMYNNGITIHYNGEVPLNFSLGGGKSTANLSKTNDYIDPSPNPWPQLSPFYPFTQNVVVNGAVHNMNMYTLISEDGVFDEPILFFEGIDFGTGNSPLRNGLFGWPEFITGGYGTSYDFLVNLPVLIDSLRSAGKDIVLVDFWDGATYIEHNTLAAKKAIKLCNEYKEGNHPLVCVGTSMGGVIARKALREMELEPNQEHCTSLFISHDAPHNGANIPIGLQALVSFMSDPIAQAQEVQQLTLLRPASRQLLVRQYHPYTTWHYNFQASLDNLGYPEECKMIAVNNGNMAGQKLAGLDGGQNLLDYNCDAPFMDNALQLEVMSLPGNPNHEDAISPGSVLAKFRLAVWGGTFGCNSVQCVWDENFQVNTSQVPQWDNMPGGFRTTLFDLSNIFNSALGQNGACDAIDGNDFYPNHTFIPTYSSLGMDASFAFQDLESLLQQSPELSPFDDYHCPEAGNEEHSFISFDGIDFLMPHILSSGAILSGEVTANASPNAGVFNYGKDGYNLIGDVVLLDGGSLLVNHNQNTHWSQANDNIVENQHFTVSSNPCSSHIRVGSGGLLHIGQADSEHTGELILRSGTVLEVEENGVLIIDKNSTLKVEEGAEIHAHQNSRIVLEEGAELLVESGSAFYVNSPTIQLKHSSAMIDLEGELVLDVFSTLEMEPTDGEMGFIRFSQAGIRLWGSAAKLKITGVDPNQKLIEVAEGAQFWNSDDFQKITIDRGLVEFKTGAQMPMSCSFTATDCVFKGTDANENLGIHVFKRNNFYNCQFQNCSLSADLFYFSEAKLRVTDSYFTGNNTKVRVNGMGYSIVGCDFAGTRGIHSQDMTEPSVLFRSRLNGSDAFGNAFRGVFDDSDVELQIRKCGLHACGEYGVIKNRGMLTLNCTEITQNQVGVAVEWALLNMARGFGGGDNILSNNTTNLLLNFALGANINYGYNEFSDPGLMNIEGSVMGSCGTNCSNGGLFACANNTWLVDNVEIGPDSNYNTLYKIDECDGIGTPELCPTTFYTFSQYSPPTCPNRRFRNPWKLASELETENGDHAFKEYTYRLSKAASLLSINNSEGNDEDVIIELAALVQSGVFDSMDAKDRYWSLVLKQTMKTALSSLNEGQTNQGAFTPLESSYVDVLNYFDDHYQAWSKVDYRLAHEQAKSSFFHARGDAQTSRTILEKSGECGLNEKLHEIHHRIKCNLIEEIAKKDSGLHSIIANEQLNLDVEMDPIENNPTGSQNCIISSASNVEFGICGTPPLLNAQLESVGIYPNPNEGNFKVILKDFQTCEEILIWNSLGQVVQSFKCTDQIEFQFNLELTKGIYIIEFRGENKSITEKLVIR